MAELRIGTSGWVYKHWVGDFYPKAVKAKDRFAYFTSRFTTTEINGTFYRLPSEAAVQRWAEQAPPGFLYAWKASRYITHNKKLKDAGDSLALVFGRMAPLGDHSGPALFQLPPMFRRNDQRLADFLALLPKAHRHTVEFRHPSWYAPEVFDLLRRHDVALCISDHHDAPSPWETTASFVYIRGHGPGGRYFGRYGAAELGRMARAIMEWREAGKDVFAYFDNDIGGAAPVDADALITLTQALTGMR